MSNVHIVKKGNTLWGISNKYNISLNELVEINGLYGKKKNLLKIGQKIYLKKNNSRNIDTFLTIKAPIDIGAISAYEKKTRAVFI